MTFNSLHSLNSHHGMTVNGLHGQKRLDTRRQRKLSPLQLKVFSDMKTDK